MPIRSPCARGHTQQCMKPRAAGATAGILRSAAPRPLAVARTARRAFVLCAAAPQPSAVISGASSGIGKAAAVAVANSGWRVFAGVRSDAAADELRSLHPSIQPIKLDVARWARARSRSRTPTVPLAPLVLRSSLASRPECKAPPPLTRPQRELTPAAAATLPAARPPQRGQREERCRGGAGRGRPRGRARPGEQRRVWDLHAGGVLFRGGLGVNNERAPRSTSRPRALAVESARRPPCNRPRPRAPGRLNAADLRWKARRAAPARRALVTAAGRAGCPDARRAPPPAPHAAAGQRDGRAALHQGVPAHAARRRAQGAHRPDEQHRE